MSNIVDQLGQVDCTNGQNVNSLSYVWAAQQKICHMLQ